MIPLRSITSRTITAPASLVRRSTRASITTPALKLGWKVDGVSPMGCSALAHIAAQMPESATQLAQEPAQSAVSTNIVGLMVERRLPATAANQVPTLIEATRSMVAACLFTGFAPGSVPPRDAAGAQVERVRGITRQHIASPTLGPSKICRLAGLSRSQLYRLFEPHGG